MIRDRMTRVKGKLLETSIFLGFPLAVCLASPDSLVASTSRWTRNRACVTLAKKRRMSDLEQQLAELRARMAGVAADCDRKFEQQRERRRAASADLPQLESA